MILAAALAVLSISHGPAVSETKVWPDRPLTMVVPLAAGSGIDVLARILAPRLSEILGQTIIVENVTGAGGTTGAARVARAAPDGLQFLLGGTGTHAYTPALYQHPPYDASLHTRQTIRQRCNMARLELDRRRISPALC
jgi:tripartite-type tricarboxylate transporter receptor subunit TctC